MSSVRRGGGWTAAAAGGTGRPTSGWRPAGGAGQAAPGHDPVVQPLRRLGPPGQPRQRGQAKHQGLLVNPSGEGSALGCCIKVFGSENENGSTQRETMSTWPHIYIKKNESFITRLGIGG